MRKTVTINCLRASFLSMIMVALNAFVFTLAVYKLIAITGYGQDIVSMPVKCAEDKCIRIAATNCKDLNQDSIPDDATKSTLMLFTIQKDGMIKQSLEDCIHFI